jgi:uncharacterized protein YecE (DUF72 family)
MQIWVGTSGWSYPEWKGSFYPARIPAGAMLRYYASHFSAVEVNNSFYRIPTEKVLAGWAAQVGPGFQFIMKASRRITHNYRLQDSDGSLEYFLRSVSPLGSQLGPILFQLPPTFERDESRLASFLKKLPAGQPAALEFRHASWFDDRILDLLRSYDVPLVAVDEDPGTGTGAPLMVTSSWGYLRLRRTRYDTTALLEWSERISSLPWKRAYVFLKHEEGSPVGPAAAVDLKGLLES